MQSKFQQVTNVVYKINQICEILTLYWYIKNSKYLINPEYLHDFCNTIIHLAQGSPGFQHGALLLEIYLLSKSSPDQFRALHKNKYNTYVYASTVGYTHVKKSYRVKFSLLSNSHWTSLRTGRTA